MFGRIVFLLLVALMLTASGCIYLNSVHNKQLAGKMHQDWMEAQLELDRWVFGMPGK